MGGIQIHPTEIKEVVMQGEVDGIEIIALGTNGAPDAWAAAVGILEVMRETDTLGDCKVLIVDASSASIRPALRLERKEGDEERTSD